VSTFLHRLLHSSVYHWFSTRDGSAALSAVIDNVSAPGGGRIGLVHCPGLEGVHPVADAACTLDADLQVLVSWGAEALVTLMQPYELTLLGLGDLGERATRLGMEWSHLPIVDGAAPGLAFETSWEHVGPALHRRLDTDGRIVLHCRAGIGRTGTVAARMLIERGMRPSKAIMQVRRARPGAIESPEQAAWVRACRPR